MAFSETLAKRIRQQLARRFAKRPG